MWVIPSNDLTWSKLIAEVVNEGNQKVDFIRRNLRGSPLNCTNIAYFTLIRAAMEYAGTIWESFLKTDINRLEAIQKGVAVWAKTGYSHIPSVSK